MGSKSAQVQIRWNVGKLPTGHDWYTFCNEDTTLTNRWTIEFEDTDADDTRYRHVPYTTPQRRSSPSPMRIPPRFESPTWSPSRSSFGTSRSSFSLSSSFGTPRSTASTPRTFPYDSPTPEVYSSPSRGGSPRPRPRPMGSPKTGPSGYVQPNISFVPSSPSTASDYDPRTPSGDSTVSLPTSMVISPTGSPTTEVARAQSPNLL